MIYFIFSLIVMNGPIHELKSKYEDIIQNLEETKFEKGINTMKNELRNLFKRDLRGRSTENKIIFVNKIEDEINNINDKDYSETQKLFKKNLLNVLKDHNDRLMFSKKKSFSNDEEGESLIKSKEDSLSMKENPALKTIQNSLNDIKIKRELKLFDGDKSSAKKIVYEQDFVNEIKQWYEKQVDCCENLQGDYGIKINDMIRSVVYIIDRFDNGAFNWIQIISNIKQFNDYFSEFNKIFNK